MYQVYSNYLFVLKNPHKDHFSEIHKWDKIIHHFLLQFVSFLKPMLLLPDYDSTHRYVAFYFQFWVLECIDIPFKCRTIVNSIPDKYIQNLWIALRIVSTNNSFLVLMFCDFNQNMEVSIFQLYQLLMIAAACPHIWYLSEWLGLTIPSLKQFLTYLDTSFFSELESLRGGCQIGSSDFNIILIFIS